MKGLPYLVPFRDEGERCAETPFFDDHRQHDLGIKVACIFNTYGPRMLLNDGRVVSNFIVPALKGNPITVHGDGQQTRSLCSVMQYAGRPVCARLRR